MDKKTIGIGLLGAWQDHIYRFAETIVKNGDVKADSFRHWKNSTYEDCRLIAAWDNKEERGKALADAFQIEFEPDLNKFLSNPCIDAVIICSETANHAAHIIAAANAGKHIFVEKSPFADLEGAYLARDAVKKSGVHFMVSSPMEKPRNRFAKNLVDEGKLGTITEVRFRLYSEHGNTLTEPVGIYNKEENGGGVMNDFGQHGVHVTSWFLGKPVSVSAQFDYTTEFAKKYKTEDNVVAVYEFENGGIGIVEAGWVAQAHDCVLDVCGTNGTVHIIGDDVTFYENGEKDVHDDVKYLLQGENWIHVPNTELPEKILYPLRHWVDNIINDTPDDRQTIDDAVLWTEMICAAYRAADKNEIIL